MPEALENRVLTLEQAVEHLATARDLKAMEVGLTAQILRLGQEMHGGFSAIRERVGSVGQKIESVDQKVDQRFENLAQKIESVDQKVDQGFESLALTVEIVDGKAERLAGALDTRSAELLAVIAAESLEIKHHARVLHEDLIARIKVLGER